MGRLRIGKGAATTNCKPARCVEMGSRIRGNDAGTEKRIVDVSAGFGLLFCAAKLRTLLPALDVLRRKGRVSGTVEWMTQPNVRMKNQELEIGCRTCRNDAKTVVFSGPTRRYPEEEKNERKEDGEGRGLNSRKRLRASGPRRRVCDHDNSNHDNSSGEHNSWQAWVGFFSTIIVSSPGQDCAYVCFTSTLLARSRQQRIG